MIPYGRQSINDADIQAVSESLRGDFLTTGPLVEKFEHEIEMLVGAPAITVSSGTAALHCAYAAIGIQPGDEVITPPITFVATQATAALLGAKIVFADVLAETANINPIAVEEAITSRTKAIVAVDYAGHPADIAELRVIADKYGIYLIEDAAHSIGSTYQNQPVGSLADITTFSFFPTKNLTTGEGGAVSSPNQDLLERAKRFSRQGLVRETANFKIKNEGPWHQEVHEFGLNYRLPDILCALGIQQLSRLDEFRKERRRIFSNYMEALFESELIQLPTEKAGVVANWHLFPIRVHEERRLQVFTDLRSNGIGVQVNYLPAYRHPVFKRYGVNPSNYPESEKFYSQEISLPMFAGLEQESQQKVIQILKKALE
jgi:dTDP-4-amino-4,6-dideoxygalactose transaminase